MKRALPDLRASIVVFLIAVPLAMGIAIASGYPPVAGLITGIVGGLIVGALSGSPLQVSGAAAGLTVLVFDGVQRLGLPAMGMVVLIAGILQIAISATRTARWFQAVSPSVLHGMLAGIGVLIVASQLHVMFDGLPKGGGWRDIKALPAIGLTATSTSLTAGAIGLLTIAVLAFYPKFARGPLKSIPAPIVGVVLASALAAILQLSIVHVQVPADILSSWQPLAVSWSELFTRPDIIVLGIELALIASAESLLSAAALDLTHNGPATNFDRELLAQGVGNTVCGLLGALPLTGVAVRSSANVQAGAQSRLATILHGLWQLLVLLLIPGVLQMIPRAALAGLLVFTGIKLVRLPALVKLAQANRGEFLILLSTAAAVVGIDLLSGVLLGVALASVRLLLHLADLKVDSSSTTAAGNIEIRLHGVATFLQLPKLAHILHTVPTAAAVSVDTSGLRTIDYAAKEHLTAWQRRHESRGGSVVFAGTELMNSSAAAAK